MIPDKGTVLNLSGMLPNGPWMLDSRFETDPMKNAQRG